MQRRGHSSASCYAKAPPHARMGMGLHDTMLQKHASNSGASSPFHSSLYWGEHPACWVHSNVFQPFLDHLCEMIVRDADGPRRAPPNPPPPTPVVWVSQNEQCVHKKREKVQFQVALANAINRASRAASIGRDRCAAARPRGPAHPRRRRLLRLWRWRARVAAL